MPSPNDAPPPSESSPPPPAESGGPKGPEPTRYNDWTIKGKCVDF